MKTIDYKPTQLHTFAICAYNKSRFLEHCVQSLMNQTIKSNIILCTSTPNTWIRYVAEKYGLLLFVRDGKSNIRDDWNYAYDCADTPYVTLAHQDDIYNSLYSEAFFYKMQKHSSDDFSIFISGYRPLKNKAVTLDKNSIIRFILRSPYLSEALSYLKPVRILPMRFGNPICCPTVTYNKKQLGKSIFTSDMSFNIDWDTFLKIAGLDAPFLYDSRSLVYYRIHDGATSKEFIDNSQRITEDTAMFNKFWPTSITNLIMKLYVRAYDTYK